MTSPITEKSNTQDIYFKVKWAIEGCGGGNRSLPWSVAKQSIISMLSHNACWSSLLHNGGLTWPLWWPMTSRSSEVKKRWWGVTSQVTNRPFSFAAFIIRICKRQKHFCLKYARIFYYIFSFSKNYFIMINIE